MSSAISQISNDLQRLIILQHAPVLDGWGWDSHASRIVHFAPRDLTAQAEHWSLKHFSVPFSQKKLPPPLWWCRWVWLGFAVPYNVLVVHKPCSRFRRITALEVKTRILCLVVVGMLLLNSVLALLAFFTYPICILERVSITASSGPKTLQW